jgi:hypothetical protein
VPLVDDVKIFCGQSFYSPAAPDWMRLFFIRMGINCEQEKQVWLAAVFPTAILCG